MESRRKRSRSQRLKWGCYILLLVVCTVLQTMPGLFQFGAAKPLWLLPLELMLLCFGVSVVVQLYLKDTPSNFVLLAVTCALLVLSADWLFFYYMPGYAGAGERFLWVVLPSALMTAPGSWLLHRAVQRISTEFKIDNGVV